MIDFYFPLALAAMRAVDEDMFHKRLMAAPPEDRARMQKERADMQEKHRVEAIAERRHKETVDAIKSLRRGY